jgi:hypothetical protein
MGDVIDGEFAEFVHDPHARVFGAELNRVESAEVDQAGDELKKCVLCMSDLICQDREGAYHCSGTKADG